MDFEQAKAFQEYHDRLNREWSIEQKGYRSWVATHNETGIMIEQETKSELMESLAKYYKHF